MSGLNCDSLSLIITLTTMLIITNIIIFFANIIISVDSVKYFIPTFCLSLLTYCLQTTINIKNPRVIILDFITCILIIDICYQIILGTEYTVLKIIYIITTVILLILIRFIKVQNRIFIDNGTIQYNRSTQDNQNLDCQKVDNIVLENFIIEFEEEIVNEICPICQDTMESNYVKTSCNHYFHRNCIKDWLGVKIECPICKNNFKN